MSMLNFNQVLFNTTYQELLDNKSFTEIFYNVFIPLLNDIGLLWQTDTISPAHEHFITALIKQKILINIELLQDEKEKTETKTYVLFLPEHEIHDLGLLFINYKLIQKGLHTIFLGDSIPISSLTNLISFFKDITFISYFTVYPEESEVLNYINEFKKVLLTTEKYNFILLGPKLANINISSLPPEVKIHQSIKELIDQIEPNNNQSLNYKNY